MGTSQIRLRRFSRKRVRKGVREKTREEMKKEEVREGERRIGKGVRGGGGRERQIDR